MLDLGLYKNWLALAITGHPILSNALQKKKLHMLQWACLGF